MSAALHLELVEDPEEVERLRCGVHRRQHGARQLILDGADEGGDVPRLAQHRVDHVGSSGFAVSPGDAGDAQTAVGMVVEIGRGEGKRLPAMLHLQPWTDEALRLAALADHSQRALAHGVGGKLGTIGVGAGKGKEYVTGLHFSRVIGNAADRCGGQCGIQFRHQSGPVQGLFQRH